MLVKAKKNLRVYQRLVSVERNVWLAYALEIKKAFESKTGNVGDINLSIAALKYADIPVELMLLSTRRNGMPTELYPVLSEFNYVIAKVSMADKIYLLDATDPYLSFGLIPNGV